MQMIDSHLLRLVLTDGEIGSRTITININTGEQIFDKYACETHVLNLNNQIVNIIIMLNGFSFDNVMNDKYFYSH